MTTTDTFASMDFSCFATIAHAVDREVGMSYHFAYREFLNYFADIDPITMHHLVLSTHLIYGWMPRILRLHGGPNDWERGAELLTAIKHGKALTVGDMEMLTDIVDHSVIAVSKLIHFVRPDSYAIWDSRVCTSLYGRSFVEDRPTQIERYFAYLDTCRALIGNPAFPSLHTEICTKIGLDVPPLRAVEWVLYKGVGSII